MAYNKTIWKNGQSPAINASNLNKIEQGIEDAHSSVAGVAQDLGEHEAATDPHTQYTLDSVYNNHVGAGATESVKGHIEIATQAEVTAGTDATRAVVPKYLKIELDKKLNSSVYTAADVLAKLKTVDTDTSGLNANTLQGKQASDFLPTIVTAGDFTVYEDTKRVDTTHTALNTSWWKLKELRCGSKGSLRISFTGQRGASGVIGEIVVRRNGVDVGTIRTIDSLISYTEDISGWDVGDLIQIYGRYVSGTGGATYAYISITHLKISIGSPTHFLAPISV